jgi:hypothetical protein
VVAGGSSWLVDARSTQDASSLTESLSGRRFLVQAMEAAHRSDRQHIPVWPVGAPATISFCTRSCWCVMTCSGVNKRPSLRMQESLQLVDPPAPNKNASLSSNDDVVFLRIVALPKGWKLLSLYLWETKWSVPWFDSDESLTCRGLNSNPRHFNSFTFISVSFGESCLLASWCAGGRCGMVCSDEDYGRSRRPDAEDRRWSHMSDTQWPGD